MKEIFTWQRRQSSRPPSPLYRERAQAKGCCQALGSPPCQGGFGGFESACAEDTPLFADRVHPPTVVYPFTHHRRCMEELFRGNAGKVPAPPSPLDRGRAQAKGCCQALGSPPVKGGLGGLRVSVEKMLPSFLTGYILYSLLPAPAMWKRRVFMPWSEQVGAQRIKLTCIGCPGTPVHDVPGLYTSDRGGCYSGGHARV